MSPANRSKRPGGPAAPTAVALAALLPLLLGIAPVSAAAQEQAAKDEAPMATAPGDHASQAQPGGVELDRLLRLPDDFDAGGERRGGATAADWRGRFRRARTSLDNARQALRDAQAKLESAAGESGDYQVAAPGATDPTDSPMNFGLREELRRRREQVEREERSLRALVVEADLADVPEDWRN